MAKNVIEDANGSHPTTQASEGLPLRTSSLPTLGGNKSATPVPPLRSRDQNPTSEVNAGKDKERPIYVSVRPPLKDTSSSDTLVLGEEQVLSPLSLPSSVEGIGTSKVGEHPDRRLRQCSENDRPCSPRSTPDGK